MEGQNTVGRRYFAILIGINDYPKKPLSGCVRDVQSIKAHLESVLVDSIEIHILTASSSTSEPAQDGAARPTYENAKSAFDTVASRARDGDFVYIHYSGHGTRTEPNYDSPFSNKTAGDLALVLHSGHGNDPRYFRGFELASLLNAMVENGVAVSLVLDCCFSASVYRHDDGNVRFLPYDAEIASKYPPDSIGRLMDGIDHPALREVSMLPNWLMNPHRYAILTACGPDEEATEAKFDDQRHGALSYYLLETLNEFGLTVIFKCVYDRLRAKFKRAGFRQSPVLYGNTYQGILGQAKSGIAATAVPIVEKKDGTLQLQAGGAHGVNEGDRFRLYSLGSSQESSGSRGQSVDAEVICLRALTSDLTQPPEAAVRVRTGWMARALTRRCLRSFPMGLASGLPNCAEWLTALDERSLDGHIDSDKCPSAFSVILSDDREYRVLDEHNEVLENVPRMQQDKTGVHEAANVLEHLARFQMIKDLANETPNESFRDTFRVHILSKGKPFSAGGLVEVENNGSARLVMENHGDQVLYFFVYVLGPCWQVENVNKATYLVITPPNEEKGLRSRAERTLTMTIPDQLKKRGHSSCVDVIKVFVTSQPTSFDLLELPKLGEQAKLNENRRFNRQGGSTQENWAAMNFSVRTFDRTPNSGLHISS
ncbi:hypothetical protein CDD83_3290 [Cordyceps sp. RAO-2017]|nr:hypothetical protein CDD83_3290 [Cordyceps sp. RAO-2017]